MRGSRDGRNARRCTRDCSGIFGPRRTSLLAPASIDFSAPDASPSAGDEADAGPISDLTCVASAPALPHRPEAMQTCTPRRKRHGSCSQEEYRR